YDGSTATVEAVMMANRVTRRSKAILSGGLHPQYRRIIETHGHWEGFTVAAAAPDPTGRESLAAMLDGETSCVVVQTPDFFGNLHDITELSAACRAKGVLLVA